MFSAWSTKVGIPQFVEKFFKKTFKIHVPNHEIALKRLASRVSS